MGEFKIRVSRRGKISVGRKEQFPDEKNRKVWFRSGQSMIHLRTGGSCSRLIVGHLDWEVWRILICKTYLKTQTGSQDIWQFIQYKRTFPGELRTLDASRLLWNQHQTFSFFQSKRPRFHGVSENNNRSEFSGLSALICYQFTKLSTARTVLKGMFCSVSP